MKQSNPSMNCAQDNLNERRHINRDYTKTVLYELINSRTHYFILKLMMLNEIKYIKSMHEYLTNLTCLVFVQRKSIPTYALHFSEGKEMH